MKDMNLAIRTKKSSLRLIALGAIVALLMAGSGARGYAVGSKANAPAPQVVVINPWTAAGSTGAADETSIPLFGTNGPNLGFRGAAGALLVARYNVTNTYDNNPIPTAPGWTTLELGSATPGNSVVTARLWQVDPCTGQQVELCRAVNNTDNPNPRCDKCTFNIPIDFALFVYYVEVDLQRPNGMVQPTVFSLRIY
jgi:hypothetical protein